MCVILLKIFFLLNKFKPGIFFSKWIFKSTKGRIKPQMIFKYWPMERRISQWKERLLIGIGKSIEETFGETTGQKVRWMVVEFKHSCFKSEPIWRVEASLTAGVAVLLQTSIVGYSVVIDMHHSRMSTIGSDARRGSINSPFVLETTGRKSPEEEKRKHRRLLRNWKEKFS